MAKPASRIASPSLVMTSSTMREIDDAAAALPETDPFRAARHPSPVPYTPNQEGAPPPPPHAPVPALSVSGIIGGPPWAAVLEGIPGRQGSIVVHPGDTLGGLRVRSVKRDSVVITGVDTTWRLIVRRAW
ncbi:MAG: hypothetical protein ACJ79K_05105 [Gemmatimonadaceae bacterium]